MASDVTSMERSRNHVEEEDATRALSILELVVIDNAKHSIKLLENENINMIEEETCAQIGNTN